jgi:transcriptional regulator with XRE-family HTH domain
MMLVTGNQLKAARALAGVEQQQLADAASVHVNTIRKMEAKEHAEITSTVHVLRRVETALEGFGVEFTNGDRPGVRLRAAPVIAKTAPPKKTRRRQAAMDKSTKPRRAARKAKL